MTFGINGPGEGVVWKLEKYPHAPTTWFKIKPEEFPTTSSKAIVSQEEVDMRQKLATFAKWVVRERRLEQGLEYLAEMHIPKNKQNVGKFLEWVVKDVLLEEKWTMKKDGIHPDGLRPEINRIGAAWYYRSVNEDENTAVKSAMERLVVQSKPVVDSETAVSPQIATKSEVMIKSEAKLDTGAVINIDTITEREVNISSTRTTVAAVTMISESVTISEPTVISAATPILEPIETLEDPKTSEAATSVNTTKAIVSHSVTSLALYNYDSEGDDDQGGVPLTPEDKPLMINALQDSPCGAVVSETLDSNATIDSI
jgi:hypothetical protein